MSDHTVHQDDSGSRYTFQDLYVYGELDALKWLRERERTFFRSGKFNPQEAVLLLGLEALDSGVQQLSLEHVGKWWILWSKRDWLGEGGESRAFHGIVHNPHGGPNNMRLEILLTAFASDVVTMSNGHVEVVKGSSDHQVEAALTTLGTVGRVVAFRS